MAHLTDMEELLATIKPPLIQDYMREAMNCYMASAYRGCIVLSYIALFDDIYDKLGELAKVNQTARTLYAEVTKKKKDQEVFEKYLIDQLKSKSLMSALDGTFLDTLKTLRNKSAHPSGHKPSPEEARFIFFEVINRFLSKPILSTIQLVDNLISRLVNNNFFTSDDIGSIESIVKEELTLLHDEAIPYLVEKLSDGLLSTDGNIIKNARFFLLGLAKLDNPQTLQAIKQILIQGKADDEKYAEIILSLIAVNAKCISNISGTCNDRIKRIITDILNDYNTYPRQEDLSHPLNVFASLVNHLDDTLLLNQFNDQLILLTDRYCCSPMLINLFDNHPMTFQLYFETVIKNAGSTSFNISNSMAKFLIVNEEIFSRKIDTQQALKLILAIDKAATRGSTFSEKVRDNNYNRIPNIKQKVLDQFENNHGEAMTIIHEYYEDDEDKIANFFDYFDLPQG